MSESPVSDFPGSDPGGFPADFLWGASTSAFQVEGGYADGGKGLSVADVASFAGAGRYADTTVAADFYHRYRQDIALMAELGLKSYRMSINWTRLFPRGDETEPTPQGIAFYQSVFDELARYGIEPIVTLYHFDLPAHLAGEYGGWASRKTIDFFLTYARACFAEFGSKVRYWLTINEQNLLIRKDKLMGLLDAGDDKESLRAQMNHHMFLANAAAIRLCHQMCPDAQIAPTLAFLPSYPRTCQPQDVMAALDADNLYNYYATDVYIHGEYPRWYLRYLAERGWSFEMTQADQELLRAGTPDFLGFNYYLTFAAEYCDPSTEPDYNSILDVVVPGRFRYVDNPYLEATKYRWQIDPVGFRKSLMDLYQRYRLPLMITENGIGTDDTLTDDDRVHDDYRSTYLRDHVTEMKKAVVDGVPVISYNAWSFIDVVSSSSGFAKRYGFVYVDRTEDDPKDLRRIKKDSFEVYRQIIATNAAGL